MGHIYSTGSNVLDHRNLLMVLGTGEIVQGRGLKVWLRIRYTWFQVLVPQLNFVTLAKLLIF